MRLLLARHGETIWNRERRYQGRSDSPLSFSGERQAWALAERFASVDGITIVSAPSMRAQATASIIATRLDLVVATDDRLVELAYGQWEGLQQAEVKQRWPEMLRQWKQRPEQVSFPGGESLPALQHRVRSFLLTVAEQSGTILAITHDGVAKLAVLEAQGRPLSAFRDVRVANGSVTTFLGKEGHWTVEGIGDIAHLGSCADDPSS